MMKTPDQPAACTNRPARQLFLGFSWAVLGGAVILALLILLLPGSVFLAISNYLQILAALAGAAIFLYAYRRFGGKGSFLFAAGGFGLWGLANIAWYVSVLLGGRAVVFPSLIDLGMIASFLLLAVAFRDGFPPAKVAPQLMSGILAFCLIIPAIVMATAGISASTIITLAYFLACGAFLMIGLQHSVAKNRNLFAGAVLFALAFMVYPLREMFFADNPVLPVIGTFVSAGFALMVIGWLSAE